MSARPDEALTRWLLRYTARVARFAAAHQTIVDVAVATLIAAASFVGLGIQGRLGQPDTVVFCVLLCAPLTVRAKLLFGSRWERAATAFCEDCLRKLR